jgi:cytochrome bd-type quinol oxidase subunit 1
MPLLIFVSVFALGLVALIAYFALSKKSSPAIRWAAIIALILIGLSVAVCLVILFSGPTEAGGTAVVTIAAPPVKEAAPSDDSSFSITIFVAIFLLFLVAVIFFSLREQRRQGQRRPPPQERPSPKERHPR